MAARRRKAAEVAEGQIPEIDVAPETEARIEDAIERAAVDLAIEEQANRGRGTTFGAPDEASGSFDSYGNRIALPPLEEEDVTDDEPSWQRAPVEELPILDEPAIDGLAPAGLEAAGPEDTFPPDEDSDSDPASVDEDSDSEVIIAPAVVRHPPPGPLPPPMRPPAPPRRPQAKAPLHIPPPMRPAPMSQIPYDERELNLSDDEPSGGQGGLFTNSGGTDHPVDVPAWSDYTKFPKTFQLRVERQLANGVASYLGEVATHATIPQILSKYPFPGTFLLWPISNVGRKLTQEPIRFDVDPQHEFFRTHSASGGAMGAGASGAGHGPTIPPELLKLLEAEKAEAKAAREEAERIRLDAEDRKAKADDIIRAREAELREREMALALNTATSIQNASEAMFTGHEKRTNTVIDMMRMQAEMEGKRIEASAERERERNRKDAETQMAQLTKLQETVLTLNAQMETRRMEIEAAREKERTEMAREREKEREKFYREREERLAKEEERLRELANEKEKNRQEHMERMITVQGSGGLGNLVDQVEGLRKVTDALDLGGSKEPKGVIGEIGDIFKEIKLAELEVKKIQAQAKAQMAGAGMSPDEIDDEFDDDEDDDEPGSAVQRYPVPAQLGGGFILPPAGPGQPPRLQPPPGLTQEQTGRWAQNVQTWIRDQAMAQQRALAQNGGAAVQMLPAQGNGASQQPQQPQAQPAGVSPLAGTAPPAGPAGVPSASGAPTGSPQVSPQPAENSVEARIAALPLPAQKAGREALRKMVAALHATGDDKAKWQQIVIDGLKATPLAFEYLKAATVYGAALEAAKAERIDGPEFFASDLAMSVEPFALQFGIPVRP